MLSMPSAAMGSHSSIRRLLIQGPHRNHGTDPKPPSPPNTATPQAASSNKPLLYGSGVQACRPRRRPLNWQDNDKPMTSSPPIGKSEERVPPEREPWWRRWLEPVVAGAIISTLLLSLVTVGVVAFQSLKGDLRDVDANLRETITATDIRLREAIAASETRLRDEMREFKAEVRAGMKDLKAEIKADMKDFKAEVKADNRALNEKLDRVLERLPAAEK